VSIPEADRQDTSAIYRKDTLAELEREIPEFKWRKYFQTFVHTELPEEEPIVSYAFPYLRDMARIVKETEPRYAVTIFYFLLNVVIVLHSCQARPLFCFMLGIGQSRTT